MVVKNTTIKGFANALKGDSFVCFGASKMVQEFCEWHNEYHFEKRIRYIGDNDSSKWRQSKTIAGTDILIVSPKEFVSNIASGEIILITTRFYYEIIQQLENIEAIKDNECYIFPLFELEHPEFEVTKRSSKRLIPKKIHYCWFGGGKKPKLNQDCIDSWKRHCPEYEIVEWNKDNCDMEINPYVSEAYHRCQQWGAISDYFSVKALYEEGGVYFDTDVQLIKNIDVFLHHPAFASFDSTNGMVNFGSGAGSIPGNLIFKEIQNEYEDLHFLNPDGSRNDAANYIYQTKILKRYGLKLNNARQDLENISIFPSSCFCPYDLRSGKTEITKNTYGIHQFDGSWWDADRKKVFERQQGYSFKLLEEIKGGQS